MSFNGNYYVNKFRIFFIGVRVSFVKIRFFNYLNSIAFKKGKAKVEIAVAKGKRQYDKRQVKKKSDWNREKARLFRKTS